MNVCCPKCDMTFSSRNLLSKHQAQFCVGPSFVEPQHLPHAISRLQQLKTRKLFDGHECAEKERFLIGGRTNNGNNSRLSERHWDTKSSKLRQLQHQMQDKPEMKRKMDELSDDQQSDDLSLSIPLPPTPSSETNELRCVSESEHTRKRSDVQELKQQASLYRSRLAECRSQGEALIAQRNVLDQRLQQLSAKSPAITSRTNPRLLDQLSAQQEKNQLALMQLQQQMQALNQPSQFSRSDDFILKEINLMRLRYLQSGGSNPEILLHIAGMEQEAIALAQTNGNINARYQKDQDESKSISEQLLALELENRRLQDELVCLHETNTEILQQETLNNDMWKLEEQEEQKLREIQIMEHEVEIEKQRMKLELLQKKLDAASQVVAEHKPERDPSPVLGSLVSAAAMTAAYSPATGFVIFYDFVGGLELPCSIVCLMASLYRGTAAFGRPAALRASTTVSHPALGVVAVIGAKQPILLCPAANDVALILEFQTALHEGQTPITRAWCRVGIFNDAGWIVAGCWRLPLRFPPVDLLLSAPRAFSQKYGNVEAFIRIVNHADSETQSMVRVTPGEYSRYRYQSDNF